MKFNPKMVKYVGAGLIVVTAFSILMPGLLKFVLGIWRIAVLIVTAVILAWFAAYIYSQLIGKKKKTTTASEDDDDRLAS